MTKSVILPELAGGSFLFGRPGVFYLRTGISTRSLFNIMVSVPRSLVEFSELLSTYRGWVSAQKMSLFINFSKITSATWRHLPATPFSKLLKLFGRIWSEINSSVSSNRKRFKVLNFANILFFLVLKHVKRPAFQNMQIVVWKIGFESENFSSLLRNGNQVMFHSTSPFDL